MKTRSQGKRLILGGGLTVGLLCLAGFLGPACSSDETADPPIGTTTTGSDAGTDGAGGESPDGSGPDADGSLPRSPIRPYPDNRFYWELDHQPLVLLGGSWQDNPFQWADGHDDGVLTEQLDLLQSAGGNYLRNVINCRERAFPQLLDDGMANPYTETGGIYDLTSFNEEFFQRLRTFMEMTEERRFVVETEIWDGPLAYHMWNHPHNPWRPSNNVNYDAGEVIVSDSSGNDFYECVPGLQNDPVLLGHQEAFVDRVLDVTLDFDNVLYTLENENSEADAFADHWAAFVHDRAASRGKTVYVTDHRQIYPMDHIGLDQNGLGNVIDDDDLYGYVHQSTLSSCYADPQYDANLAIRDLLLASSVRPMNYDKSFWFIQCFGDPWSSIQPGNDHLAAERLWVGIFSGVAAYRFHRDLPAPDGWPMGLGLNSVAQIHLRSMRMLLESIDVFAMEPHNDLITGERQQAEAFVLAEPGRQVAIYLAGQRVHYDGGQQQAVSTSLDNRVELSIEAGDYAQEWLDIDGGSWSTEADVQGGTVSLDLPDGEQWAVVLRRR